MNADYEHIFIQKAYNKSWRLQNDAIELKLYSNITTLVLTQPGRRAHRLPTASEFIRRSRFSL